MREELLELKKEELQYSVKGLPKKVESEDEDDEEEEENEVMSEPINNEPAPVAPKKKLDEDNEALLKMELENIEKEYSEAQLKEWARI